MRTRELWLSVLLACGWSGCQPSSPTTAVGEPLSGAEANVLGELLDNADGRFAYRMPTGWTTTSQDGELFPVAMEPMFPGYRSNIRVSRERVPLRFDVYLAQSREELARSVTGAKIIGETDFTTSSGVQGRRWIVESKQGQTKLWQAYYFFPAEGDDKVLVTASATSDQGVRLGFVFDAAMKTLVLK